MRRTSLWLLLLVATLAATLGVLATLQYRWLGDLSAADEQRMRGALDLATREIGRQIDGEVNRIGGAFQGVSVEPEELTRRADEWANSAHDVHLVSGFFVAAPTSRLFRLDVSNSRLVPVAEWPAALLPLKDKLPSGDTPHRPPLRTSIPAFVMPIRPPAPRIPAAALQQQQGFVPRPLARLFGGRPPFAPPLDEDGPPPGGDGRPPRRAGDPGPPGAPPPPPPEPRRDGPPPMGDEEPPAQTAASPRPAPQQPAADESPFAAPSPQERRPRQPVLIALLDRDYILHTLLPDLARRSLGPDCDLAVLEGNRVLYRSLPSWPRTAAERGEVESLFMAMRPPNEPGDEPWRLLVRRHSGAVADFVEAARRRNLAVGFAVLLLLAASIILLAVLARRAERMRLQQLEFVAGITHELNTPIAAVSSAGQNLADGIVAEPAQVARYGAMITKEAKRLSETVAQVLDFAGLQRRDRAARRETIDVTEVAGEAVAQCRWLAEEAGVTIEENIARGLPRVEGDPLALTRAIQNLVANAIRHAAEGKWVGVTAARDGAHVLVRVEDRGPGVPPREARHLFEPFFRGRGAARVRGSGLGLAIVRQVALAHGGSVALERRTHGASFVLRLPAASAGAAAPEVQHA
jgi:signal transduction histidine kinase